MKEKIKWGVLGYGKIAREKVIPAIVRASNSEFYAIASRNNDKAKACQEKFGCQKTYATYDELLDDPEIQAVYIPLPNALHKEWTIKAARKNKHILCEKPIGLNTDECLEMIKECEKNNVKLMEAFMYRYSERTKKVKELLDSGIIGDVKYINSTFRFLLNRANDVRMEVGLGGGSLYDVGCYPINFSGMITGKAPVAVSAESILENGVDVQYSGVLKYDNGIIATINSGFNTIKRAFSEIGGTKGIMEIPDIFLENAGEIKIITADEVRKVEVPESDHYRLEVEDFADAIINDRQPQFSLEDTVMNMAVIDQLFEAIHSK